MLSKRIRSLAARGAVVAVACAFSGAFAANASAARVAKKYCIEVVFSGAFEDCNAASVFLVANFVAGSHPICAGAFLPNERVLFEEYICGGVIVEQTYGSGVHLRPVVHNHGTPGTKASGVEEYIT